MDELMIKVDNITKEYRLGAIGGTTLREELQRARAKRKHQEDPTLKIGQTRADSNERFMALNGVSFKVKKGEAVGIIGHNGAGKSTLLKLVTRITAPTTGDIYLNGRVASMLEVGTGFHPELTGRENVYLNGAILGMTKKEIDAKMEDIIEFSEVRQFIDTPVKRYSSGMYVKLAFSVAAHLDSEIMIMDEVLAVGDVAFQNKCIKKMRDVANSGRTILYVSHNMNTIMQLCDRCIVLENGHIKYDGDVQNAIDVYLDSGNTCAVTKRVFSDKDRHYKMDVSGMRILSAEFINKKNTNVFKSAESMVVRIVIDKTQSGITLGMRQEVRTSSHIPLCTYLCWPLCDDVVGELTIDIEFSLLALRSGMYHSVYTFYNVDNNRVGYDVDSVPGLDFVIEESGKETIEWDAQHWGQIEMPEPRVLNIQKRE